MSAHAAQAPENKTPAHSKAVTQKQGETEPVSHLQDHRPRTLQLQHLQHLAHTNPRTQQTLQLQARIQQHTLDTVQRVETVETEEEENPAQGKFEPLQRVASGDDEEPGKPIQKTTIPKEDKKPLQGKFETVQKQADPPASNNTGLPDTSASSVQATQRKSANKNNTGLPDTLKSGIENLSGYSLDDVKVHYNSPAPAQLQAHAYAQGTDIHVAPGQEKHLPHEAWHVVQQKQGRVQPTTQLRGKVAINDDSGLEKEADVMGAKAMQMQAFPSRKPDTVQATLTNVSLQKANAVLQGVFVGFGLAAPGWGANNAGLPGAMDVFPGGGLVNVGGGQQGGGTARTIDIASKSVYTPPGQLGGFTNFSNLYGNKILFQPGGKAKRYTHLHIINGKTHGPGTADNLTLGSTGDNNAHRAQVEDPIRNGLGAIDTATTYFNNMAATPPDFLEAGKAYWDVKGGGPLAMVGAKGAPPASKILSGGVLKPYTHLADPNALPAADTRWAHYTVAPNYGGALSPTIRANMALVYTARHEDELDIIDNTLLPTMAPPARPAARAALTNAKNALNAAVTPVALAGGVGGVLAAANLAADGFVTGHFAKPPTIVTYQTNMAKELTNMNNFAAWVAVAFPTALICDADLYRASYDPVNVWFKRSEVQTNIPINQN